jgi:DNA-binding PadR family transcriptional regulator
MLSSKIMSPKDHESMTLELRRGAIILSVLSQLGEEYYGYSLRERLAEKGMPIPEGTLYPLLRRLESMNLLTSSWRVVDGRPRRYYRTSDAGAELLARMETEWRALVAAVDGLLEKK